MASGPTYNPIATYTFGSAAASYTFSNIPSYYTDLVMVVMPVSSNNAYPWMRFNGDSGNYYVDTSLYGNGSSQGGINRTANSRGYIAEMVEAETTQKTNIVVNILNYSNSTTYKTYFARGSNTVATTYTGSEFITGTYNGSKSPISSITVGIASGGTDWNLDTGTVITLYGIKAA